MCVCVYIYIYKAGAHGAFLSGAGPTVLAITGGVGIASVRAFNWTYTYVYVCVCVYRDIHTYMHACIHTYIHTYMHTQIHTHIRQNDAHRHKVFCLTPAHRPVSVSSVHVCVFVGGGLLMCVYVCVWVGLHPGKREGTKKVGHSYKRYDSA